MFNKIKDRINAMDIKTKLLIATGSGIVIGVGATLVYVNYKCEGMVITPAGQMFLPSSMVDEVNALEAGQSILLRCVENGRIIELSPSNVSV